jgi:hypothetical protein
VTCVCVVCCVPCVVCCVLVFCWVLWNDTLRGSCAVATARPTLAHRSVGRGRPVPPAPRVPRRLPSPPAPEKRGGWWRACGAPDKAGACAQAAKKWQETCARSRGCGGYWLHRCAGVVRRPRLPHTFGGVLPGVFVVTPEKSPQYGQSTIWPARAEHKLPVLSLSSGLLLKP